MFRTPMSLDRTHRTLTIAVGALIAAAFFALSASPQLGLFRNTMVGLLAAVLLVCWAMSPRALVVDSGELRIERRAWRPVRIPLTTLASAAPLDGVGLGTIRIFGVGGFFGSYGLFYNAALGRFRMYATRRGQAMIVRRKADGLPLVITPDDVEGSIRSIRAICPAHPAYR
jgi:hypothetical protein